MNKLLILITFFSGIITSSVFAQKREAPENAKEKLPVNQIDAQGKKQGMWWYITKARMGEPGITEFGNYDHGIKYGPWYKINNEGDLVSIENFRNNVLDGEVKYYDHGQLYCIGHYRGLNPKQQYDTIVVTHPITHEESYKVISTDNGTMKHGTWFYYNPQNGHLVKEEEYQVDELIYHKEYEVSSKADSTFKKIHQKNLPHNKGDMYTPPHGKDVSYTTY